MYKARGIALRKCEVKCFVRSVRPCLCGERVFLTFYISDIKRKLLIKVLFSCGGS